MTAPIAAPSDYADFQGLDQLKRGVRASDPEAIRETARQFESLFTHMMLKSMREASQGEGMGESDDIKFYQDMFDQQLAVQLSKGDGIGLATRLTEQLMRLSLAGAPPATTANATTGAAAASAAADATVDESQRSQFVASIRPFAEKAASQLGVAPEAVIAQAALETGWGRHMPADSQNLFGIKASGSWQGAQVQAATREVGATGEQTVTQPFRSYNSAADSVADYASLIAGSSRYAAALNTGNDVHAFATALKHGGYATDPQYVQKVVATADTVRRHMAEATLKSGNALPIPEGQRT